MDQVSINYTIIFQGPPKFTQIYIFGLKTNHLATLTLTVHWSSGDRGSILFVDNFGTSRQSCKLVGRVELNVLAKKHGNTYLIENLI
jgi:hypothetical protein